MRVIEYILHGDNRQVCRNGRGGDVVYKGVIAFIDVCCGSNDLRATECVATRGRETFLATNQNVFFSFCFYCQCCHESSFCVIPSNMTSEFR